MAGTLLQAAEQTRNHHHGSTGQSAPSIHSVWARCAPLTGWGQQSHQRAKTQQSTGACWHHSWDIPVWWWHIDIMHAPAVHKAVGSCRTTTIPQRCINDDHLQDQGRQDRLQELPWHLTSISCRKMPCKDHPQMPSVQHQWQNPSRKPVWLLIRS